MRRFELHLCLIALLWVAACAPLPDESRPMQVSDDDRKALKLLTTSGLIVRVDCDQVHVDPRLWHSYDSALRNRMAMPLAAACDGKPVTVLDSQTSKPIARVVNRRLVPQ